ncbi:MAG: hypothetical protein HC903_00670 [Methylacidiphilales bacterium]|nr:hypothetical protein [Candidatus Methylacidiphilales bacterium]NJR15336.1 hypothetical protein [Calothrix sp. CSU_2_0]
MTYGNLIGGLRSEWNLPGKANAKNEENMGWHPEILFSSVLAYLLKSC